MKSKRQRGTVQRLFGLALLATVGSAMLPGVAGAQAPVPGAPSIVDGPSADIAGLAGMSVARDGSGALAYSKSVAGVTHVFVSRLVGGVLQTPQQVDSPLAGASSQPVVAAGNGGLVLISFINGGQLYGVRRVSFSTPYSGPTLLFNGAANPSLTLTNFGKGYLAFTAVGAGGHDIRAAYYANGRWALESAPLDAFPSNDAGTGTGRPRVIAAGDGVAIVVWGEAGHIYSRRLWRTSPSVVYEQADVPSLAGWSEVSADLPSVGSGGDSSYADVVFREVVSSGSATQSRVLMRRLHASRFDDLTQPDGLVTPAAEGANQPQIAMTEYGHGLITSGRDSTNGLYATVLGENGVTFGTVRVDSLQNSSPPDAVPASVGPFADLVAWQHDPGSLGTPEIRVRYAPDGSSLGPELALSSSALGPTDAASGLAAGGDNDGNAVVAWVQGIAGARRIVAAQLYEPPEPIGLVSLLRYSRRGRPLLRWIPPRERWGAVSYAVSLDNRPVGQTTGASVLVPYQLADGPHAWQVTAINSAGLTATGPTATVWVDTAPPAVRFSLSGVRRSGARLAMRLSYTDSPPPLPPGSGSGIAEVRINWGDGSGSQIGRGRSHAYHGPGRYRVTVRVKDRAGNATTVSRTVRIAA